MTLSLRVCPVFFAILFLPILSLMQAHTSFDTSSSGTIRIVQPFDDQVPPKHPVSRHMQKVKTLSDLESWVGGDIAAAATDIGGSMDNKQNASKYASIYSQWGPNMGIIGESVVSGESV